MVGIDYVETVGQNRGNVNRVMVHKDCDEMCPPSYIERYQSLLLSDGKPGIWVDHLDAAVDIVVSNTGLYT